jgi:hypothetical protein
LLAVSAEVEVAAEQPEIGAHRGAVLEQTRRRLRVAHDRGPAAAHDVRLFPADALAIRTQVVHVIEIDAGDHGAIGVDDVDHVQATAKADLENHDIGLHLCQRVEDGQRSELVPRE